MKICFLGDANSIHIQRWVEHFTSIGNEVHVVSFTPAVTGNAAVHYIRPRFRRRVSGGNAGLLGEVCKIRKAVNLIRPDILHSHYLTSYGLLGALIGYRPYIATAWGTDVLVTPKRSFLARGLLVFTLRRCDFVTGDSKWLAKELTRHGLEPERLKIVHFGVDTNLFTPRNAPAAGESKIKLISTRFLDGNANVDVIIRAMAFILRELPQVSLDIINEGPELPRLQKLVKDLSLQQHIRFVGRVDHLKLPGLLQNGTVYLSLLNTDSVSVSLLEAMSCGLYPVVSDNPANRELVSNGKNGTVLESISAEALAEGVISAVCSPELLEQTRNINSQLIKTGFSWRDSCTQMERIYSQVCRKYAIR